MSQLQAASPLTPNQREFLKYFASKFIYKKLDSNWQNIFDIRTGRKPPPIEEFVFANEDPPIKDCFTYTPVYEDPKKRMNGSLKHFCTVSPIKAFWEFTLAFYPLFFPEVFPDQGFVAKRILSFFPDMELDPRGVENFPATVWVFLTRWKEGKPPGSSYFTHPIETFVAMHLVLWTQQFQKMPPEEVYKLEDMLIESLYEKEEKELKDWEERWEKLKKEKIE
jgi:hypothetical protein